MADPIIAVDNVSKSYGGVKANVDISSKPLVKAVLLRMRSNRNVLRDANKTI